MTLHSHPSSSALRLRLNQHWDPLDSPVLCFGSRAVSQQINQIENIPDLVFFANLPQISPYAETLMGFLLDSEGGVGAQKRICRKTLGRKPIMYSKLGASIPDTMCQQWRLLKISLISFHTFCHSAINHRHFSAKVHASDNILAYRLNALSTSLITSVFAMNPIFSNRTQYDIIFRTESSKYQISSFHMSIYSISIVYNNSKVFLMITVQCTSVHAN